VIHKFPSSPISFRKFEIGKRPFAFWLHKLNVYQSKDVEEIRCHSYTVSIIIRAYRGDCKAGDHLFLFFCERFERFSTVSNKCKEILLMQIKRRKGNLTSDGFGAHAFRFSGKGTYCFHVRASKSKSFILLSFSLISSCSSAFFF